MRLVTGAHPSIDQTYQLLRAELEADDPRRAPGLRSALTFAQQLSAHPLLLAWLDDDNEQRPPADLSVTVAPAAELPADDAEAERVAHGWMRQRLEQHLTALLPALQQVAGAAGNDLRLHVRPLRSRLTSAFTLPTGGDTLILFDDAVHDLIYSLTRLMVATWPSPRVGTADRDPRRPALVPMPDAVRIARAELGSMRWHGALWEPIRVALPPDDARLASLVAQLAVQFVLAHEVGHGVLHHRRATPIAAHDSPTRERAADRFAVQTLRTMLHSGQPDSRNRSTQGRPDAADAREDNEQRALDDLLRLAVRSAVEILGLVDHVRLVRPASSHPRPVERLQAALADGQLLPSPRAPHRLERYADHFFGALHEMTTDSRLLLPAVVAHLPALSLARDYSDDDLAELSALDAAETMLHAPLPSLLDVLADLLLPVNGSPPLPVQAACARADILLGRDPHRRPLGTTAWLRQAAGYLWLVDVLLGDRPEADVTAALQPTEATRFVDWAPWLEAAVPADYLLPAMAALAVLRDHGLDAPGPELTDSGLLTAVRCWLLPG